MSGVLEWVNRLTCVIPSKKRPHLGLICFETASSVEKEKEKKGGSNCTQHSGPYHARLVSQLPLILGMAESGPLCVFQRRPKILDDLACCVVVERAFELNNSNDDKCSVAARAVNVWTAVKTWKNWKNHIRSPKAKHIQRHHCQSAICDAVIIYTLFLLSSECDKIAWLPKSVSIPQITVGRMRTDNGSWKFKMGVRHCQNYQKWPNVPEHDAIE